MKSTKAALILPAEVKIGSVVTLTYEEELGPTPYHGMVLRVEEIKGKHLLTALIVYWDNAPELVAIDLKRARHESSICHAQRGADKTKLKVSRFEARRQRQDKFRAQFGSDYRGNLDLIFANPDGTPLKPDIRDGVSAVQAPEDYEAERWGTTSAPAYNDIPDARDRSAAASRLGLDTPPSGLRRTSTRTRFTVRVTKQ